MSPFSPNFVPNSKAYYSQAPEGQSLGKCNAIPCLGSPVFIIEKAHDWISQQFDISNTQSSAKLIAFKTNTQGAANNSIDYHLLFELSNYFGSKYIGVLVNSPIQGFGSAKYKKFILNSNLDLVLEIIGLSRSDVSEKNCGDNKLYYSYFNRGDSS